MSKDDKKNPVEIDLENAFVYRVKYDDDKNKGYNIVESFKIVISDKGLVSIESKIIMRDDVYIRHKVREYKGEEAVRFLLDHPCADKLVYDIEFDLIEKAKPIKYATKELQDGNLLREKAEAEQKVANSYKDAFQEQLSDMAVSSEYKNNKKVKTLVTVINSDEIRIPANTYVTTPEITRPTPIQDFAYLFTGLVDFL